jgi:hypothetical protein
MSEPLTPDEERARIIAELKARPGPKPLKPIPPEIMAEILADQIPYEQAVQEYRELMEKGGYTFDEVLAAFDRGAGKSE